MPPKYEMSCAWFAPDADGRPPRRSAIGAANPHPLVFGTANVSSVELILTQKVPSGPEAPVISFRSRSRLIGAAFDPT